MNYDGTNNLLYKLQMGQLSKFEYEAYWEAHYAKVRHESLREEQECFDGKNGIWYDYDFRAAEHLVVSLEDTSGWRIP